VTLEKLAHAGEWKRVAQDKTDGDGRAGELLPPGSAPEAGTYRLTFMTGVYFGMHNLQGFYPQVSVIFEIADPKEHYHVPLLLSPYGYSTYRGS
jgi:5-hydroxyisourate hydrolase